MPRSVALLSSGIRGSSTGRTGRTRPEFHLWGEPDRRFTFERRHNSNLGTLERLAMREVEETAASTVRNARRTRALTVQVVSARSERLRMLQLLRRTGVPEDVTVIGAKRASQYVPAGNNALCPARQLL